MNMNLPLIILLFPLLSFTHTADIQVLTLKDASVELTGEVPKVQVNSVVWRWNKLKIAEWKKEDEVFYNPSFRSIANLNTDTWALTLSDLQPTYNGQYTLEINDLKTNRSFQLAVLIGSPIFALESGSIELVGEVPSWNVASVLWLWEKNELAEWDQGEKEPIYYLTSQHAVKLNMQTWALTISNLRDSSDGTYRLFINGVATKKVFDIIVVESVPRPVISKQCGSTSCTLICKGGKTIQYTGKGLDVVEYTEYTWTDNKGRKHTGSVLEVEKSDSLNVIYTCKFSNPLHWNTSSISERELFTSASPQDITQSSSNHNHQSMSDGYIGFAVGVSTLVIVCLICLSIYVYKKKMNVNPRHSQLRMKHL